MSDENEIAAAASMKRHHHVAAARASALEAAQKYQAGLIMPRSICFWYGLFGIITPRNTSSKIGDL